MFISLDTYLDDAVRSFHFAVNAAWDQHERYPEFSRGKCLHDRSFLLEMVGADSPIYNNACELADQTDDKSRMDIFLKDIREHKIRKYNDPKTWEWDRAYSFHNSLNDKHQCYFHIHNAKRPESFLADKAFVIADFRHLMEVSEAKDGCTEIFTATWLNSLDRFLYFFPKEWKENMFTPDDKSIQATSGWQGQFINRFGLLNEKVADYYLKTGKLRYKRCESWCTMEAMRAHLKSIE